METAFMEIGVKTQFLDDAKVKIKWGIKIQNRRAR